MSFAVTAAVVGVAGAAAVANQQEIKGREAQKKQQEAMEEGMTAEQQMFEKSLELQAPYREAGYGALSDLQGLVSDPSAALNDFYGSDQYSALANQASANAMRGASAQGGLRGGSTYSALENVAPQLGQNYLANQYQQLTGLANMGMGAASQGASGYNQLGMNQSNMYNQIGANQANQMIAASNNQANMINSGIGMLGNAGMAYFGGGSV